MPRIAFGEPEAAAMRRQLCQAALVLYREAGYEAVSFRRLAEHLGTSHTRPYRYFEGKEALFADLRLRCLREFAAVIRESDLPGADPATRLRAVYHGIMRYVRTHPAEYRLIFAPGQPPLAAYPELLATRRAAFDYLVAIVQVAVDEGRISGDARTIVHVAWSAVHGVLSLHTADQLQHGRDLDALVEPVLQTVLGPLLEGAAGNGTHIRPGGALTSG